ncbi:hypothetical protein CTEN210_03018 [Chaetoceros tenuissimus]|uniref:Uncharacterized protein n=1 Tax=Chaetoceros tenuissimus TaxID=426638 RepID=A0AAD3CKQ2_9STRA|nr:hypothetical protein CTEN210_03018 [Chaetoceros tenuissimus]
MGKIWAVICIVAVTILLIGLDAFINKSELEMDETYQDSYKKRDYVELAESYRFLQFDDDDRHGSNPNDKDSTNSPNSGFTYVPSDRPTMTPSQSPSHFPTLHPSLIPISSPSFIPTSGPSSSPTFFPSAQPSLEPSSIPSSTPSLDPCKGYNGKFGINDGDFFTIGFLYGIEGDKNLMDMTSTSLSVQVSEVEQKLLDLLIPKIFPDCDVGKRIHDARRLNVFGKATGHFESQESETRQSDVIISSEHQDIIVGLESIPMDLATGDKCVGEFQDEPGVLSDCSVIAGRMNVYLTDTSKVSEARTLLLQKIKQIMDDKLLDDFHITIMRVMFLENILGPRTPTDDDEYEVEPIEPLTGGAWMYALAGALSVFVMGTIIRYMYSRQSNTDGSKKDEYEEFHDSSADFVESKSSLAASRTDDSF